MHAYPFGRAVTARPPSANGPRSVFLLGAYPSALHVEWTPPAPYRRVKAIPVDDEPTPFWDGEDQEERVRRWQAAVGFDRAWGSVRANPEYNGPCGKDVRRLIFEPLGMTSNDAWITDALDTYRLSDGAAKRIEDTFGPWADAAGLARPQIEPHPEESAIWQEALRAHRGRLEHELSTARPETVITLGNAALRVLREIVGDAGPRRLAVAGYGTERVVRFKGRAIRWLPLAHPAAPAPYPAAHAAWASAVARRRE